LLDHIHSQELNMEILYQRGLMK